jgi:hypothetical protein
LKWNFNNINLKPKIFSNFFEFKKGNFNLQGKKIKYILIILVFLGISFPALSEKKFENWQDLKFKNIVRENKMRYIGKQTNFK